MVTHSSILAWRIPWTEEPGRLQSIGSKRVGHDWVTSHSLCVVLNEDWNFKSAHRSVLGYYLIKLEVLVSLRPQGTIACQAPLSMGFSRQEYWSGLLFPSAGDLPSPGIKPQSPSFQADALTSEPPGKPPIPLIPEPWMQEMASQPCNTLLSSQKLVPWYWLLCRFLSPEGKNSLFIVWTRPGYLLYISKLHHFTFSLFRKPLPNDDFAGGSDG